MRREFGPSQAQQPEQICVVVDSEEAWKLGQKSKVAPDMQWGKMAATGDARDDGKFQKTGCGGNVLGILEKFFSKKLGRDQ